MWGHRSSSRCDASPRREVKAGSQARSRGRRFAERLAPVLRLGIGPPGEVDGSARQVTWRDLPRTELPPKDARSDEFIEGRVAGHEGERDGPHRPGAVDADPGA